MSDFEWNGDYTEGYAVRETPHGVFRAVVMVDLDYPEPPEFEEGCPVLDDDFECAYGEFSHRHSGLAHTLADAFERLGSLRRANVYAYRPVTYAVDRWLRIFYGGSLEVVQSTTDRSGPEYIVYDTRAMRERWGQTGEQLETSAPEAAEWQAYIDGEVYGIRVDRATDFDEDGTPEFWEEGIVDGSVWGFYGQEYAEESALEELDATIAYLSRDMLPLSGGAA